MIPEDGCLQNFAEAMPGINLAKRNCGAGVICTEGLEHAWVIKRCGSGPQGALDDFAGLQFLRCIDYWQNH